MEWLEKINEVWNQLEYHHNPVCIQIEDKLRGNKLLYKKLKDENSFEDEVLKFKEGKITTTVSKNKKNEKISK